MDGLSHNGRMFPKAQPDRTSPNLTARGGAHPHRAP